MQLLIKKRIDPATSKILAVLLIAIVNLMISNQQLLMADQNDLFTNQIKAILEKNCISCHNQAKAKGGLDLTSHSGLMAGGESGHVIDPVNPEKSLLLEVLGYEGDIQMPPRGKLPDSAINSIRQWIRTGAAWPEDLILKPQQSDHTAENALLTGPKLRPQPFAITPEDRKWWSFQPITKPAIPFQDDRGISNPIDHFLLEKLKSKELQLSRRASRRELIRRAYFDLIGLPPTPEAVSLFEQDDDPKAWEKLIDELLASPHYGERWGRHWLDLVRFAETNGYERDGVKPFAWRYRDYVIDSFNADKPYDQFIIEQLAGDELPGPFDPGRIIATGYYRLHVWDDEPDSTIAAEFDDLDDIMVTTGATFLGLTLGCARCHDHKSDPLSQSDYYSLLAHFRSINPYGLHKTGGGGRGTGKITRILAPDDKIERWTKEKNQIVQSLQNELQKTRDITKTNQIKSEISKIESNIPFDQALAINEDPLKPTLILRRGDAHSPASEVQTSFPAILNINSPEIKPAINSSGRRLAMARWIASPNHPLTSRVFVNRLWQHHFGRGIVPTANDFGRTGEPPTNRELLDYLADAFISGGFRIKAMHRLIMTSRAYQQSSKADRPEAITADQSNSLFWRQNPRRLEAEILRDTLLRFSGNFNPQMHGPGIYPALPEEVHRTQDSARKGWPESPPDQQNRRSIYIFAKRALVPPILETFDCPSSTVPVGNRPVTTVAPQALLLLNDEFVRKQAADLAEKIINSTNKKLDIQVEKAFLIVLQRRPSKTELKYSLSFLNQIVQMNSSHEIAFRQFCLALMNLNEVIYVD
jgi:hypothetical protein